MAAFRLRGGMAGAMPGAAAAAAWSQAAFAVPQLGWVQILAYCGFVEYSFDFSQYLKGLRHPKSLGLADPKTAKARASAGLVADL